MRPQLPPLARRAPLLREVYGRLIRRRRVAAGRTLAQVSAEARISLPYLSEIERGLKEPSSEVLAAICVALDSSVTDLVGAAHRELREQGDRHAPQARVLDLTPRRASPSPAPSGSASPGVTLLAA